MTTSQIRSAIRRPGATGPSTARLCAWTLVGVCCLVSGVFSASGASAPNLSLLPPPSAEKVDFRRDIKPIFEARCLRCHGAERPKSRFSLVTRAAALRGGEHGVDIMPGDSAQSPLIHYTARLVPDMEMPPEGKSDPLTTQQVGLLRAWIDQGAVWNTTDAGDGDTAEFSFAPAVRWTTVSGNAKKFQELQWVRRGTTGGSQFRIGETFTNGAVVLVEGHAFTDDFKITLDLRREDLGYVRLGLDQFRKYYDDRGPYFPFRPSGFTTFTPDIYQLHRDLHLDDGKAFAEVGLTLPDWPRIVIGYEFQYRNGTKSTEQYGPVTQTSHGTNFVRNIFPAWKDINEDVHILKLEVSHDVAGVHVEDTMHAEFWDLKTARRNDTFFPAGQAYPTAITLTRDTHDQLLFANTLTGAKAVNPWLFVSAGYLFSQLDADATLSQTTADGAGRPASGTFWTCSDIVLKQATQVMNLNGLGGPWDGFTAALGVLADITEQEGFGDVNLQEGDPNDPTVGITPEAGLVRSDIDKIGIQETAQLRYTSIPHTALFAEARLKQEEIGKFEEEIGGAHDFLRDTDNSVRWQEYKAGFDVSPVRQVALNASYTYRLHQSDYNDLRDEQPHGTNGIGYPAFIRSRDSETHFFETRLVLRPASWVKTTLSYRLAATDFQTSTDPARTFFFRTPGGGLLAGMSDASTYSANISLTPWRRFYLSSTFSYQDSRTVTFDNASPAVAPYRGDLYTVLVSATYALAKQTDVTGTYNFSRGRYGQHNFAGGLPLGIDYDMQGIQVGLKHQFHPDLVATLQYGFFDYDEPTAHGFNDYTAHMIFGTLAIRLP